MKDTFTSADIEGRIDVNSNDGDATKMFNSDADAFEDDSTGKLNPLPAQKKNNFAIFLD